MRQLMRGHTAPRATAAWHSPRVTQRLGLKPPASANNTFTSAARACAPLP